MNRKPVNFPNLVAGELRVGNTPADYGVYGTGTVQKFELGTRYRLGDRVFRYGKAGAALNPKFGALNYLTALKTDVGLGIKYDAAIGDTSVYFTVDATTGTITKNQLVGGYWSQPDGTCAQFRKIIGQKGSGTVGAIIQIMLDGPLTRTCIATSVFEILQNPYSDLRRGAGNQGAVMGMPTTIIANGSYGWFQTWGPYWINPEDAAIGSGNYSRTCVFMDSGGIKLAATVTALSTASHQIAGWIIDRTPGGDWTAPPFLWLSITP